MPPFTEDPSRANVPSLLDGWSRAHVIAHLANVAEGLVRMTGDALAHHDTNMYPGGRDQRNADIDAAARVAPKQLLEHFERSAAQLATTGRDVPRDAWGTVFTETELGAMQLGRLVTLRLTEVEVHHADLAV